MQPVQQMEGKLKAMILETEYPQKPGWMNTLTLCGLFLTAIFTLMQFILPVLPAAQGSSASFSAERAMNHLSLISQAPRPLGSPQHSKTRDYLLQELTKLGLAPMVQVAELPESGGKLENVVAKLSGWNSSGAIVLMAHYDSEAGTPGAGDNGTGTAILLETARYLTQTGPFKNDVIVLFTDVEELGMLGSTAFVSKYPWMSEVRLALNFDTVTFGPAFMWQTSPQNGWLVHQYMAHVPHPMSNSWLYEVSRLLPLDTDLTPFIDAGVSGYNFSTSYLYPEIRTAQDRMEIVSIGSVQHAGEQSTALVRYLANADLTHTKAPDLIYFNLWGPLVVEYPASWSMPLAVMTLLFLFVVLGLGIKKRALSWRGIWKGLLFFWVALLTMLLASLIIWMAGFLIKPAVFTRWLADPRHARNDWLFFAGLTVLAVGATTFIYQAALKKNTLPNLLMGVFFFWGLLGLMSSAYLPGAGFLFVWPLLFSLLAMAGIFLFAAGERRPNAWATGIIWFGAGIPALLLWIPFILLFYLATALGAFPILVICMVLLSGILLPLLVPPMMSSPKLLSGIALLAGILFLAVGVWVS